MTLNKSLAILFVFLNLSIALKSINLNSTPIQAYDLEDKIGNTIKAVSSSYENTCNIKYKVLGIVKSCIPKSNISPLPNIECATQNYNNC